MEGEILSALGQRLGCTYTDLTLFLGRTRILDMILADVIILLPPSRQYFLLETPQI